MEIDLEVSLEPEISEVSNYDAGESNVCVSQFLVENDFETRSFLHHSTLMHKFKDFVDQNNFVDVKLVGSDSQGDYVFCHRLVLASASPMLRSALNDVPEDFDAVIVIVVPHLTTRQLRRVVDAVYVCASPEDDVSFDLELANDFASLGISIDITCSDQSWIKNDMAIDIIHSSVDIDNDVENGISQSSSCNFGAGTSETLDDDDLTNDLGGPFCCSLCPRTFDSESFMMQHYSEHGLTKTAVDFPGISFSKNYECQVEGCFKRFQSLSSLSQHKQIHKSDTTFICLIPGCCKTFATRRYLMQHTKVHTDKSKTTCVICERELAGKHELECHMRLHSGEKPYSCNQCGRMFRNRSTRNNHVKIHGGDAERKAVCPICSHAFIQKGDLRKHMRSHTGEKPFVCGDCGKTFARSDYLSKHTKVHSATSSSVTLKSVIGDPSIAEASPSMADDNDLLLRDAILSEADHLDPF